MNDEEQNSLEFMGYNLQDPEEFKELVDLFSKKLLEEGVLLKDLIGIPVETMNELYRIAYYLFQSGQYLKAGDVFKHLMVLDTSSYRYAFGMGACLEKLGDNFSAINAYTLAYINNSSNPIPLYHAAECCIFLNNTQGAKDYLKQVINIAGDNKKYKDIKGKAELLKQNLMKSLAEVI